MVPSRVAFSCVLLASLVSPVFAEAQHRRRHGRDEAPTDPAQQLRQTEARAAFQRGGQFYQDSDWAHAIEAYRQAFDLWPNPVILFNLAQAYRRDGQLTQATETFQRYLREAPQISNEQRVEVEEAIREIADQRAVLTFEVEPAGATITLDGRELGQAPLARNAEVLPGEHRVRVALANHEARDETVMVRAHDQRLLNVRLRRVDLNARLVVNVSPTDARIRVNDEEAGAGHVTREVRPGPYTVVVSREGYTDETRSVNIAPLGTETLSVTLSPRRPSVFTRPWFWGTVGGVVLAGVLTAVIITSISDADPVAGNGNPSVIQTVASY
jgi:hypothetical protein